MFGTLYEILLFTFAGFTSFLAHMDDVSEKAISAIKAANNKNFKFIRTIRSTHYQMKTENNVNTMRWTIISMLLCFFGFLREMRPSEPFVTDYLIYPWRNITSDTVTIFQIIIFKFSLMFPILNTTHRLIDMSIQSVRTHMQPSWY